MVILAVEVLYSLAKS